MLGFIFDGLEGAGVGEQALQFPLEVVKFSLVLDADVVFDCDLHSERDTLYC